MLETPRIDESVFENGCESRGQSLKVNRATMSEHPVLETERGSFTDDAEPAEARRANGIATAPGSAAAEKLDRGANPRDHAGYRQREEAHHSVGRACERDVRRPC